MSASPSAKFVPATSRPRAGNGIDFEPLLDSSEASALLKIHPKTLQRMARNGEISGIQIGKLWRFPSSELDHWLRGRIAG